MRKQLKEEFILPYGSRGLESIILGNAWHDGSGGKLANHIVSIHRNQRERGQDVETGYKPLKP